MVLRPGDRLRFFIDLFDCEMQGVQGKAPDHLAGEILDGRVFDQVEYPCEHFLLKRVGDRFCCCVKSIKVRKHLVESFMYVHAETEHRSLLPGEPPVIIMLPCDMDHGAFGRIAKLPYLPEGDIHDQDAPPGKESVQGLHGPLFGVPFLFRKGAVPFRFLCVIHLFFRSFLFSAFSV